MVSRRSFLKSVTAFGTVGLAVPSIFFSKHAAAAATLLDPSKVPQFVNLLPNPLASSAIAKPDSGTSYTLKIKEFTQKLGITDADGMSLNTLVWGYGTSSQSATYPGPTFEVQQGSRIYVTFENTLIDPVTKAPIPHRLPIDTTLDWANPGAVGDVTPVPVVSHLHGGDSAYLSDGLPDAWSTPDGQIGRLFSKAYTYENLQEAAHLWYHDHARGITRSNVYMGLAGFYFIRDNNENTLRNNGVLPKYPYEVPLVIQDRQFTSDGKLFYPAEDLTTPGLPSPTHLPEFFGDVIMVNGKAWPKLDVEPRKYRFRILNGSDSRFYDLRFQTASGTVLPIMVIGNELGLLDYPATPDLNNIPDAVVTPPNVLPVGTGERYDIIVDFSGMKVGARIVLTNTGNAPYPDGDPIAPGLTDRIMAFDVISLNTSIPNATVNFKTHLRAISGLMPRVNHHVHFASHDSHVAKVRRILLLEGTDIYGRLQTMLGTVDPVGRLQGTLNLADPITEEPQVNTQEIWEFYNTTEDAHPIHMHLVDFRVLNRQKFTATVSPKINTDGSTGGIMDPNSIALAGPMVAPGAWESGRKDTVKAFPGQVTRVLVSFKRSGEYVYHCHILSHEDHEMMRRYRVI